jgi:hypothetical protein
MTEKSARRGLLVLLAALTIALSACYPAGKPVPPAPQPLQGFDAACAPTLDKMTTWWNTSPYTSVGVYLGGSSVYCKAQMQPHFTASWVSSVVGQGWKVIPIWVGPQSPCTALTDVTKFTGDPNAAATAGVYEAYYAAVRAQQLGMASGPIYYDLEAYPSGNPTCVKSVQEFMKGWAFGLHYFGHTAGMYSSLCSGIKDLAASPDFALMDSIWPAAWPYNSDDARYGTYVPNLFGMTCGGVVTPPDWMWAGHTRLRQFRGGHNEMWGGVTISIDTDAIDGLTYP